MTLSYGEMADLILTQTYRDASFSQAAFDSVVSAVKILETNQLFINTNFVQLPLVINSNQVALPNDFVAVLELALVANNNNNPGNVILTAASGFREMTFWELQTYQPMAQASSGNPYGWALWGNSIYVTPYVQVPFYLNLYYYNRDGYYPVSYQTDYDTSSIWLGDFTQDATRYYARGLFYADVLQSPELAASEFSKSEKLLSELKIRNSQRETINVLSM